MLKNSPSNSYFFYGRLLPAILCAVPFFIFVRYFLDTYVGNIIRDLTTREWIGGVSDATLAVALIFLFMQLSRIVAKEFFENRVFENAWRFPTTNHLLHFDPTYSAEYTKRIHEKIKGDFGIVIPPPREEKENEGASRMKIAEAVSLIRRKAGTDPLVLQHNAEYGFVRNLVGGSVFAFPMSLVDTLTFSVWRPQPAYVWLSLVLAAIYFLIILLSGWLLPRFGRLYAHALIQKYMAG